MKKILLLLIPAFILTLFILTLLALPLQANPFSNLPSNHWSYNAVNQVASSGIMKNYSNGMFNDNSSVSRYQMATIITNLLKLSNKKGASPRAQKMLKKLAEEFCPELELLGAEEIVHNFNKNSSSQIISCMPDYNIFSGDSAADTLTSGGSDSGGSAKPIKVTQCEDNKISLPDKNDTLKFGGSLMIRPEFASVGRPAAAPGQDSKSVTWYAVRLNVTKKIDKADLYAEIHQYGYWGEREDNNPYSLGTMTSVNANGTNSGFKEFWAKLYFNDEKKHSLTLGRQGFRFDMPMHMALCDWRGPGRTFDAILYENKINKDLDWNLFYSKVNQDENWYGSTLIAGVPAPEQDSDFMGLNIHWNKIKNNRLSLVYYEKTTDDLGDVNTNLKDKTQTTGLDWKGNKNNYKYRLHYARQDGYNVNALGAKTDYDGNMLELQLAYQLNNKNELGLNYVRFSGDDAGPDNTAYQPVFPACHAYLGYADQFLLSNIKDLSFSFKHKATDTLSWSLDFHQFTLDKISSAPAYYGYGMPAYARPAHGAANTEDDLGFEWDLTASYKFSKNISFKLGHSKFTSGDYFTDPQQGGYGFDANWTFISSDITF
jgi:hypothetical protein